jgi:Na+-translocating ferredoxin:NAD+ oxidoreductase RNF subunit RnfB
MDLKDQLYDVLAQTDCAGCGYDNCECYAQALANREATDTSLCIAGDDQTQANLDKLLAQ